MTPVERVQRLVQTRAIAPDEGERLLAAISREPVRPAPWMVINPFDRFGGGGAAMVGAVVSGLSILIGRLGIQFDGFLDLHVSQSHLWSLRLSVVEQVVAWILPALLFWAYARVTARHVRSIDFLGMIGLARLPLLLAAVPIALLDRQIATSIASPKVTPSFLAIAVIGLLCVAWNLTLLYQGFKNASGLRGARLVGGFVAIVVVAEALSKFVLILVS